MNVKTPLVKFALGLSTLSFIATISACDPVPRRTLSTEEKIADLYWIYSQYGENYAPLEYKEKTLGINFEKLKTDYVEAAKKTTTNDEFYDLMFKFVAEFQDAHNSASLTNSSLPDRASVAFLGFSGIRNGDSLLVKKLLPTISKSSAYPIKTGDLITEIDGKKLKDAIKENLLPLRHLGNEEANYSFHMNKLFTRISTMNGLPKSADAILTVVRDKVTMKITLPWVTKDLFQFQAEQEKAKPKTETAETDQKVELKDSESNFLMFSDSLDSSLFKFNFVGFNGRIEKPVATIAKVMNNLRKHFADGFRMVDFVSEWTPVADTAVAKTPLELLKEERSIMSKAVYLSESKTFPAYIAPKKVYDSAGKETEITKLIGYVYVDTFSPESDEEEVLKEFKATLDAMQSMGVSDLVIDTINNGGGSLVLGMKMAQMLSSDKIEMPKMQFRLSDSWMDQFHTESLNASSDAEGEYARRILAEMELAKKAGKRLSEPYSAEILAPFSIQPNKDMKKPFKIVLLINEMCASMCDIFAGILQDNKMATVMGTRSMGAGGNVVNYNQAPNSHLDIRQTESLILRMDGSYIENNGVTPDKAIVVTESAKDKYSDVLTAATNLLIGKPETKREEK
jgi:C-terminal processing protease CtpA/Prc